MDTPVAVNDRDFGNLEAKVQGIEDDMTEVKGDVKQILMRLSSAEGGWKTLMGVATVSAAIGGLITKFGSALLPFLR